MALLARCTTVILLRGRPHRLRCGSPTQPQRTAAKMLRVGVLVCADEFDGSGIPDSTKWMYEVGGHGWGNNELQFYTESRRENARIEGGVNRRYPKRAERSGKDASDTCSRRYSSPGVG